MSAPVIIEEATSLWEELSQTFYIGEYRIKSGAFRGRVLNGPASPSAVIKMLQTALDSATAARDARIERLETALHNAGMKRIAKDEQIEALHQSETARAMLAKLTQCESQLAAALARIKEQQQTIREKQEIIAEMQKFIDKLQN